MKRCTYPDVWDEVSQLGRHVKRAIAATPPGECPDWLTGLNRVCRAALGDDEPGDIEVPPLAGLLDARAAFADLDAEQQRRVLNGWSPYPDRPSGADITLSHYDAGFAVARQLYIDRHPDGTLIPGHCHRLEGIQSGVHVAIAEGSGQAETLEALRHIIDLVERRWPTLIDHGVLRRMERNDLLAPPPAPPAARWIGVEEAARRSGYSTRHIHRACGDIWLALGLAKLAPEAAGAASRWVVREDADPKFAWFANGPAVSPLKADDAVALIPHRRSIPGLDSYLPKLKADGAVAPEAGEEKAATDSANDLQPPSNQGREQSSPIAAV